MRGVVIQGGGSYGAYTAGRICSRAREYDVAVGSSTGALIAPFALSGTATSLASLREAYTTLTSADVFTNNPFYKNGIPNIPLALYSLALGRKGITDSKPLRRTISKYYTDDLHRELIDTNKRLYVAVTELNSMGPAGKYHYFNDYSYGDWCDIMWASTLIPALVPPLNKNGVDLVDGGTTDNVGLRHAIDVGCDEIDVYLHVFKRSGYKEPGKNWLHNLIRAAVMQRSEVVYSDIYQFVPAGTDVELNFLDAPLRGATYAEFIPKVMSEWFDLGSI